MTRRSAPLAYAASGFLLAVLLAACAQPREILDVTDVAAPPEVVGDSLRAEVQSSRVTYIEPERPRRDVAPDRDVDVLHTALDVSFDFARRAVVGTATHRVTSLRDSLASFYFHAVAMEIDTVTTPEAGAQPLAYAYDGERLTITPERPLRLGDTLTVRVEYMAFPEKAAEQGGAFVGQGVYFIDPDGTDPYRPTQIWTQGESEDSRRWFPTWDYPNDRMTVEIALTVPDSLQTFANGTRVASAPAASGGAASGGGERQRRDVWRLDAHSQAAYLTAFVVGDFVAVESSYGQPLAPFALPGDPPRPPVMGTDRTIPLAYIVEPRFADRAEAVFGETARMMYVFERFTGVPYPWPNYKQAAVRDFTAGGMENTTLTVLYEGVQSEPRGELGRNARDLISHELAHQWFGDLVAATDWANLALNESFATFMEEVYLEKAFGQDAAQEQAILDRQAYLEQAETLRRPIVWTGYKNESQMFDRHTYQKGGQVLAMLEFELGEPTFRRALRRYLTENTGKSAEMDDLREAMEAESGRSLRRFFDQWFYQPGHPSLRVEGAYFSGSSTYTVEVVQTQDREHEPVFHFPVEIEINFADGSRRVERVRMTSTDSTYSFSVPSRPAWVRFDHGDHLLAEIQLVEPVDELVAMLDDDEMAARYDAVDALGARMPSPTVRNALLRVASGDAHPLVRRRALAALAEVYPAVPGVLDALLDAARDDPEPEVRADAIALLCALPPEARQDDPVRALLAEAMEDEAYVVIAEAVETAASVAPLAAFDLMDEAGLLALDTWGGVVEEPVAVALGQTGSARGLGWLVAHAAPGHLDAVRARSLDALSRLAIGGDAEPARQPLRDALGSDRRDVRLAAAVGLGRIGTRDDINRLDAQLEVETDEAVRQALLASVRRLRAEAEGTVTGR